jgi:hypothetical protein
MDREMPSRALFGADAVPASSAAAAAAAARGVALRDLDFDALDALWDNAKAEERSR